MSDGLAKRVSGRPYGHSPGSWLAELARPVCKVSPVVIVRRPVADLVTLGVPSIHLSVGRRAGGAWASSTVIQSPDHVFNA